VGEKAVKQVWIKIMKEILAELGVSPSQCIASAIEVVKLLLTHGADPNARDKDRLTPLHWGACAPPEALKAMLSRGADPNARDRWGKTPPH
jgi:ankyrin repeat protein